MRILRQAETGKVTDVCREHEITEQRFYRWRPKYAGMDLSNARRLKELEEEDRRLKALVAAHADNPFVEGEGLSPKARRQLLGHRQMSLGL